jgi:hypothetical protein
LLANFFDSELVRNGAGVLLIAGIITLFSESFLQVAHKTEGLKHAEPNRRKDKELILEQRNEPAQPASSPRTAPHHETKTKMSDTTKSPVTMVNDVRMKKTVAKASINSMSIAASSKSITQNALPHLHITNLANINTNLETPPNTSIVAKPIETNFEGSTDSQSRYETSNRLRTLGENVDWKAHTLSEMLDSESRIRTANRLKARGESVDWTLYSLNQLLELERSRRH